MIIFLILFLPIYSTLPVTIVNNADFIPIDENFSIGNFNRTSTRSGCACLCLNNSMCLTAVHSTFYQSCTLYMATSSQGTMRLRWEMYGNTVLMFKSKPLPGIFL